MNSLSFSFGISLWIVIILVAVSVGLTIFSYWNTTPPIPKWLKSILSFLRIAGIFLLLFALIEPMVTMQKTKVKPPTIVTLLDNSLSMKEKSANVDTYQDYKKAVLESKITTFEGILPYKFDEQMKRLEFASFDSLSLSGQNTNLSVPFQRIHSSDQSENTVGIVLFSDGNYTIGQNPIHDALKTNLPIYVVGIGDSIPPKDASVITVLSNEITFKNNTTPVSCSYRINGFEKTPYRISLFENGTLISEKNLQTIDGVNQYSSVFDYTPKEAGMKKITFSISALEGEISKQNNSQSILVNVLDTKRKVALFAGAPSPDVSFLSSVFSSDKSIELQTYIQKLGSEFYDPKPTAEQIAKSDIIVFVGFPIASTPKAVLDIVQSALASGKPLLFVTSATVDYKKLLETAPNIPFTVKSSSPQEFVATAHIPQESDMSNSLLRLSGNDEDKKIWNNLPPIYKSETFVTIKANAEVLSRTRVNSTVLNEPLIIASTGSTQKTIAILGYGIYRWKLLGTAEERSKGQQSIDVLEAFVDNSIRWLSISDNKKQVKVKTSKKRYYKGEKVIVEATVLDAQYQAIDNATVECVFNKSTKKSLSSIGGGLYRTTIDGFAVGDYSVVATASKPGSTIGSDNTSFIIDSLSIEQQALPMNVELLRSLAKQSGGQFYTSSTVGTMLKDIQNRQTYRTKPVVEKENIPLWKSLWLVLVSLTFFSIEWILRKRSGLL
jgi:hypothetical protein